MSIKEMEVEELVQETPTEPQVTEQETAQEVETPMKEEAQAPQTEEVRTNEIDWHNFGLPQFSGRKTEEIASYVKQMFKKYGDQANELGELRKLKEKYGKVEETISGKQVSQEVAKLDDYEYKAFADMFIDNPIQALDKYVLPKIEEKLMNKVFEKLDERIKPQIEGFAQNMSATQNFRQFAKNNPDYVQYQDLMGELMTEQHLGEDADFDEVYQLAKLYQSDSKTAAETYNLMKRGLPYNQAKRYASGVTSIPSEQNKAKLKTEINQIRSASKPSGVKAAMTDKNIKNMDDAIEETLREIGAS